MLRAFGGGILRNMDVSLMDRDNFKSRVGLSLRRLWATPPSSDGGYKKIHSARNRVY